MKLQAALVTIETAGTMEETQFGIADTGMMMEHMITTIYSDTHGTIAREITSNARDAHREAGKADKPIRVRIPSRFDDSYEVRDWGIGISPDRMSKVFVQLGNSTKRNDNMQTGGFGIGAKTPWCYTDVFNIRTTSVEADGIMRRREYSAVKAGQKFSLMEMGAPILIDDSIPEDDRCTGTSIIVPMNSQYDGSIFLQKTINYCQYWDVRPEIVGVDDTFKWPVNEEVIFAGPNWKVTKPYAAQLILIDGIPYPFNFNSLNIDRYKEEAVFEFFYGGNQGFTMSFGVGELSLSLNRENVKYTEDTVAKIKARMIDIIDCIACEVSKSISCAPTLWDAYQSVMHVKNGLHNYRFRNKSINWNGVAINTNNYSIKIQFRVNDYSIAGTTPLGGVKLRSTEGFNLHIHKDVQWIVNDENFVSRAKIVRFFKEHPNIQSISMIKFSDNIADFEAWQKEVHWDLFAPNVINLSTLPKLDAVPRVKGASTPVMAYEFNKRKFEMNKKIDLENDSGVFVYVNRRNSISYSHNILNDIQHKLKLPCIVGIPERFSDKIGPNWTPLEEIVKDAYDDAISTIDAEELKLVECNKDYTFNVNFERMHKHLRTAVAAGEIKDATSPFVIWVNESEKVEALNKKYSNESMNKVRWLAEITKQIFIVGTQKSDLEVLKTLAMEKYPLLFVLASEYYITRDLDKYIPELIVYINAKNNA